MRRTMILAALLVGSLVGSTLSATAALGTKPQVETFEDQGFFGLPDLNCQGFKLLYTLFDEHVTEITFFDQAGNPVRVLLTFQVTGLFTNSKTGEAFRDHAAGLVEIDLLTGVTSVAQLGFVYHTEGEGLLFLEAGRQVFDAEGDIVFQAGPDDFLESGFDGICAALA